MQAIAAAKSVSDVPGLQGEFFRETSSSSAPVQMEREQRCRPPPILHCDEHISSMVALGHFFTSSAPAERVCRTSGSWLNCCVAKLAGFASRREPFIEDRQHDLPMSKSTRCTWSHSRSTSAFILVETGRPTDTPISATRQRMRT